MFSIYGSDNFKIYLAETKKVGSKYIHVQHGGGLPYKNDNRFHFFEKISDKIIRWDGTKPKQDIFENLSPTVPVIKLQNAKIGNNCSIIFYDLDRYIVKAGLGVDQSIDFFNKLTQFVKKLNPEIKPKIKFRVKLISYLNFEKKFSEIFGKEKIDKVTYRNSLVRSILNSKLIIVTHPQTAFSEAMYSNIPTILIVEKNHFLFSKAALDTFNVLKKNKIAFEDFDEAKTHINKYWKELDLWWKSKNVQSARKIYLTNFFNVKSDWYREWSDYIYFSKKL